MAEASSFHSESLRVYALTNELSTVTRDHGKLIDAIIAGIPADQVKERMDTLTERKAALEAKLAKAPNADPIRFYPKMALTYRDKVTELINRLSDKDTMLEAMESLRALLERIVLVPSSKTDKLDVHIHGDLAGLLLLSMGAKHKNGLSTDTQAFDSIGELVLVAGGRNCRSLPLLRCKLF